MKFKEYISEAAIKEIDLGINLTDIGKSSMEVPKLTVITGIKLNDFIDFKWSKQHGELWDKPNGDLYVKLKPQGKMKLKMDPNATVEKIKNGFLKALGK
jgi:hypothetical protein